MAIKKPGLLKKAKAFTKEDYNLLAESYADISAKIKALEETKKKLADQLKEGAATLGTEDDKGSFYLEGANYMIGKVSKKSMSLNLEKATPILNAKKLYKDCVDTVTSEFLNEEKVTRLVKDGKLKLSDVKDFTDVKQSFSISVVKIEELPDVEVTTFSSAAKRKGK